MAEIDINQITNAVVAELRNGATDMAGITPSTALNDSDNVLAQEGSTLKKLPVSLFKQIVAAGATVYRLTADSVVFKATTTAVAIGVTKSEGGEVTVLSTLPTGWKIGVHCESGDSYQDTYYSAPTSIDPHAWESVAVTLYDGDPQSSSSAQAVDIVTLRLVSDGEKGDKGDTGEQGPQGEKGEKGEDGYGAIANDLTTDDADKALSAAMGVVLNSNSVLESAPVDLMQSAVFQQGTVSAADGSVTSVTFSRYTEVAVEPDTCYYLVRPRSESTNYQAVVLMDADDVCSTVLDVDGAEYASPDSAKPYVFISCYSASNIGGVFKTRSDTTKVRIALVYGAATSTALDNDRSGYHLYKSDRVIVDAAKSVTSEADALLASKSLKVLLIGSSHGINTVELLPWVAKQSGYNVIVGELYKGSVTLANIADNLNDDDFYEAYYENIGDGWMVANSGVTHTLGSRKKSFDFALSRYEWDVIILQRSAAECYGEWSEGNSTSLKTIINYIGANTSYTPRIVWNSGFAYPVGGLNSYTREQQQAATESIMKAAASVKSALGIDYIPVAKAVQLCRNDDALNTLGSGALKDLSADTQHLDAGVGAIIPAMLLNEWLLRSFNKSILTTTGVPTFTDVQPLYATNIYLPNAKSANFTAPTSEQVQLIKWHVMEALGDDGEDGATAGSLILQPYNDYECYNVTALDYETGIVTVDSAVEGSINVGDYVAVTFNTSKDGGSYFSPITRISKYTFSHFGAYNASFLCAQVTAVDGKQVTVSAYINSGKGTLANATYFMLVHYGSTAPSTTKIELPSGYQGKPLRVELVGQCIGKSAATWNNWTIRLQTNASTLLMQPGSDGGHGTSVHDQVDFLAEEVWLRDLAYIYGYDTTANRERCWFRKYASGLLEQGTVIQVPYQFTVPFNIVKISIL